MKHSLASFPGLSHFQYHEAFTGLIPRPPPLSVFDWNWEGLETRWGTTHPSSPLKVMLSLFFCRCLISDFITCSYASSSRWSRRMLNFSREPWVGTIQYHDTLLIYLKSELGKAWHCPRVYVYDDGWKDLGRWEYCIAGNFCRSKFSWKSVSPPEEIFAV